MIASLHNHTKRSDGNSSPRDFFEEAHKSGMQCVAFTDHDALLTDKDIRELSSEQEKQGPEHSHWVSGIEMTASLRNHSNASVHITGLFVDWNNKDLIAHCNKLQTACRSRMEKIVTNLRQLGFKISAEDCLAAAGREGNVRRPHIVKALSLYPTVNEPIIRQLIEESCENPLLKDRANGLRSQCPPPPEKIDYNVLYPLLFTDDALIPGIYVDYEYTLSVEESAELIRKASGICLFAHYYLYRKILSIDDLRKMVVDGVIDGVETIFERKENYDEMVSLTKELNCLPGGGGDIHEKEVIAEFIENQGELTKGVTETLLLSGKISPESIKNHSSLYDYYKTLLESKTN